MKLFFASSTRSVIYDNLPSFVGLLEDQREHPVCISSLFFASLEVIPADHDGIVLVQRMNFEVGEVQGSHCGSVGIIPLISVDHSGEAAVDGVGDEQNVRRIL